MDQFTPDTALALLNSTSVQTTRASERLKDLQQERKLQGIEDAAQDFEAVFLSEMMKPMFETVEVDSMFGGGKGEEIFRSFMLQEYGKMMSASGSIGISDRVKAELIRLQGAEIQSGTELAKPSLNTKNSEETQ
jgi:Rod binding domain-containing protein